MPRPITSRIHGVLDYSVSLLLVLAPVLFGFTDAGVAAVVIPVAVGLVILLQSLITNYELSVVNVLPLALHLAADVVVGLFLALSPFLFGFAEEGAHAWLPHVVVGIGLTLGGLLTETRRHDARRRHGAEPQARTNEWPDAPQPGPAGVDVTQTRDEARRPTGTGR